MMHLFGSASAGPAAAGAAQRPDQLAQLLEALQLAPQGVDLAPAAVLPHARGQVEALRPLHHACRTEVSLDDEYALRPLERPAWYRVGTRKTCCYHLCVRCTNSRMREA